MKVPKDQVVGEVNKGWDVAKYLLGHEREMISGMGLGGGGSLGKQVGPIDDPLLRAEVAAFDVDSLAFTAMSERFIDQLKAGEAHPAFPSVMKYAGTELNKRRHELVMAAGGSDALEWDSERSQRRQGTARLAPHQGQFDRRRHVAKSSSASSPSISSSFPGPDRMAMMLTDDQAMLRDTAREFLADEGTIKKQLRHWRDTGCSDGFGTELWRRFGELGLNGICIPESAGGLGSARSKRAWCWRRSAAI